MKRYRLFSLFILCTGIFFLFGSFTSVFEETPFMKAVMDNRCPSGEIATDAVPVENNKKVDPSFDSGEFMAHLKSVVISGINRVEEAKIKKEALSMMKQDSIMSLLSECMQKLDQLNANMNSKNSLKDLEVAQRKLADAMQLVKQLSNSNLSPDSIN
ncbi:MAG: hypothetical protein IT254_04865 [Chitinophagaceae bacterium]|nr:hypothetical protein [Bacteroidota bacterium]MCC6257632.1 hypothetical protein [Chitinophagaceae bacterium]MCW5917969.1 hypothetical protein [Ferruginibacter sp.]